MRPSPVSRPSDPLDALWRPGALGGIILIVVGLAVVLAVARGKPDDPLDTYLVSFGLFALLSSWIALLTVATLYVLRGPLSRTGTIHVAWLAVVLLVLVTGGLCLVAHALLPGISGDISRTEMTLRAMAIALTVGLLSFGAFHSAWRNLQLNWRAQQAELAALQARTRPHFLFNTLNAAISLVRQQPARVEDLLLDLSDLLRAALAAPQEWSLEEEIALTRKYLDIERLRFGDRLRVQWNLPEPLPALRLPMLALQPLVENSVLHGIEPRPGGGVVEIDVRVDERQVSIAVRNELPPAGAVAHRGHQVGLASSRERVRSFTQGAGALSHGAQDGHYVVTVTLPHRPLSPR